MEHLGPADRGTCDITKAPNASSLRTDVLNPMVQLASNVSVRLDAPPQPLKPVMSLTWLYRSALGSLISRAVTAHVLKNWSLSGFCSNTVEGKCQLKDARVWPTQQIDSPRIKS